MEESRRYLFGSVNPDEILPEFKFPETYFLPQNTEIVPCHEAQNGEWVPDTYVVPSELEEVIDKTP